MAHKRSLWPVLVLIAINLAVYLLCLANVSHNNFALKSGWLYDQRVFVFNHLFLLLVYYPLSAPIWVRILMRRGLFHDRRLLPLAALVVLLSLIFNFPAGHVILTRELDAGYFAPITILYAITKPLAAGLAVLGFLLIYSERARSVSIMSNRRVAGYLLAAFVAGLLLRWVLAGTSLPRLEDEMAYYVQSLLFANGDLRGVLEGPASIAPERLRELAFVPYLIYEGNQYYSAHFHGWSMFLAVFQWIGLAAYANAIITLANVGLFYWLLRETFTHEERTRAYVALLLFVCSPLIILLAGTYMSHPFALSILLTLVALWYRGIRKWSQGDRRQALFSWALICPAVIALMFVRPQIGVGAGVAFFVYDLALVFASFKLDRSIDRRPVFLRLLMVPLFYGAAFLALRQYVALYDADDLFFTVKYFNEFFVAGCQNPGIGPGHGCFPTYGTVGHSFRKMLIVLLDLVSALNQELAMAGFPLLPLAIILGVRHYRRLLDPRGPDLVFLLLFGAMVGVFGLYFHNGGESYRGRYLYEPAVFFYILLARLFHFEWEREGSVLRKVVPSPVRYRVAVTILSTCVILSNVAILVRGDYFNLYFEPYHNVNDFSAEPVSKSLINAQEIIRPIRTADEFTGEERIFDARQSRAFLNAGYATLAGTATRIDRRGFLRDADDNALVANATNEEALILEKHLGLDRSYRLKYQAYELERINKYLKVGSTGPPTLTLIENTPEP